MRSFSRLVALGSIAGVACLFAAPAVAAAQPPAVTHIRPNAGRAAGGTSVEIEGKGFESGSTVSFGGKAATGVTFKTSEKITATSPAGSALVNITVTNSKG